MKDRQRRLIALMQRYNQLARLLPNKEDVLNDADKLNEAKIILAELKKAIDYLRREGERNSGARPKQVSLG